MANLDLRQFIYNQPYDKKFARVIDNHFHLEMIAENAGQMVEYQKNLLQAQQEACLSTISTISRFEKIADRQDQTNSLLNAVVGDINQLVDGIGHVNFSLDNLAASAEKTIDLLFQQTGILRRGFNEIALQMLEQKSLMQAIANTLCSPYETQALELVKEAENALAQGMKSSGRNQEEEFKDAERLLTKVLENPIGCRNYVAWFQTGWLNWKMEKDFPKAEEAFYQAARLSASKTDLYHSYSLRHCAYMQYLQGKFTEAYDTINKVLPTSQKDHDLLYDAARYAEKTNRTDEALELLNKCIDLQPQTIITMLSEADFSSDGIQQGLISLLLRKTEEGRVGAKQAIESLEKAIQEVQQMGKTTECTVQLVESDIEGVLTLEKQISSSNYIQAVDFANTATSTAAGVYLTAAEALKNKLFEIDQSEEKAKTEIERIKIEHDKIYTRLHQEFNNKVSDIKKDTVSNVSHNIVNRQGTMSYALWSFGWNIVSPAFFAIFYFAFFARFVDNAYLSILLFIGSGFFGFVLGKLVNSILWKQCILREEKNERCSVADAESNYKKSKEKAAFQLEQDTASIDEIRKKSKSARENIEAAFDWLKTKPGFILPVEEIIESANTAVNQGADDRAINLYYEAIEHHPKDPKVYEVYFPLAGILFRLHRVEEAITVLEKALSVDPDGYSVNYSLGNLFSHIGQKNKAQTHWEKALKNLRLDRQLTISNEDYDISEQDLKKKLMGLY